MKNKYQTMLGQYRIYLCKNKQGRIIEQGKASFMESEANESLRLFSEVAKSAYIRIETVEDTIYIDIFLLTQILSTFLSGSSRE